MEWLGDQAASSHRVRLPAEWEQLFGDRTGEVRLMRTFHRPTNLDIQEEVDLVFQNWPGLWVVSLNDRQIGELRDPNPERIGITAVLQPSNQISFQTRVVPPIGERQRAVVGGVALEIRRP
jgi:hypothetical protein